MNNAARIRHIIRSTTILMAAFLLNKGLGIARQMVIANAFGTSNEYDAFVAAFRLPDILYMLISGGALATAFIPVLSERLTLHPDDDPHGWKLSSAVLNTIFLAVIALSLLISLFAQSIVSWEWGIAPGFDPATQQLTANLMRLVLLSTIIFSISGLLGGILNAHQHFILPAIAPLLYNLGIIIGALFLTPAFGVYGLIFGTIIGAAGHLLIQVPGLFYYGIQYHPILNWRDSGVQQVARLMGPRILTIAVIKLNFMVMFNLASRLDVGNVSALDYGWDLMQMPQTIIGTALGIVLFPTLTELAARNDRAGLRATMAQALRVILVLALPAMVGLIALGRPAIQVMFERGEFDARSTTMVYQALQFWALALLAHCAMEVVNRIFYAQKDTTTPLISSALSTLLNIGLALWLYRPLGAGGLALSNAIAVSLEIIFLLTIARWRIGGVEAPSLLSALLRAGLAAGIMGIALSTFTTALTFSPLLSVVGGGLAGIAVYLMIGSLLRIEEIGYLLHYVAHLTHVISTNGRNP